MFPNQTGNQNRNNRRQQYQKQTADNKQKLLGIKNIQRNTRQQNNRTVKQFHQINTDQFDGNNRRFGNRKAGQ